MVCKSCIDEAFQTSTGFNISTETVWPEHRGLGFHGLAVARKHHIIKYSSNSPLAWQTSTLFQLQKSQIVQRTHVQVISSVVEKQIMLFCLAV